MLPSYRSKSANDPRIVRRFTGFLSYFAWTCRCANLNGGTLYDCAHGRKGTRFMLHNAARFKASATGNFRVVKCCFKDNYRRFVRRFRPSLGIKSWSLCYHFEVGHFCHASHVRPVLHARVERVVPIGEDGSHVFRVRRPSAFHRVHELLQIRQRQLTDRHVTRATEAHASVSHGRGNDHPSTPTLSRVQAFSTNTSDVRAIKFGSTFYPYRLFIPARPSF